MIKVGDEVTHRLTEQKGIVKAVFGMYLVVIWSDKVETQIRKSQVK